NIKIIPLEIYNSKVINDELIVENEYEIYIFNKQKFITIIKNEITSIDININSILNITNNYNSINICYLQNSIYYHLLFCINDNKTILRSFNSLDLNKIGIFQDAILYNR